MINLKILVFDEEELTKTLIESYLKDLTFPFIFEKYNEFNDTFIEDTNENKIIIISINKLNSDILDKIANFSKNKKNNFIVISYDKSANISVKAFRNGAKEFLLKPLIKTDFLYAIHKIYNRCLSEQTKNNSSKVYTASSLNKSDGKSTFLVNLAKEAADISKEKVLFIDFNKYTNNEKNFFKTNANYNANYLINNLSEKNIDSLISKLVNYKNSSLYVITNNSIKMTCGNIDKRKISKSIDTLKKYFKYIFIDKCLSDYDINANIETIADTIFYIFTIKINNSKQIQDKLSSYKEKNIIYVCNKYDKKQETKLEEIKSITGQEITIRIPQNIITAEKAFREHKTIKEIEPMLDISEEYFKIAKRIISRD